MGKRAARRAGGNGQMQFSILLFLPPPSPSSGLQAKCTSLRSHDIPKISNTNIINVILYRKKKIIRGDARTGRLGFGHIGLASSPSGRNPRVTLGRQESWKMEQDETGCQPPPEGPALCANNCGFYGSAATMNLCSKCHGDLVLKPSLQALDKSAPQIQPSGALQTEASGRSHESAPPGSSGEGAEQVPDRCGCCRKRLGLTGFKCRCGLAFCGLHRYSDKHNCQFDYRTSGRDAIAKANPVVKAEKIEKI